MATRILFERLVLPHPQPQQQQQQQSSSCANQSRIKDFWCQRLWPKENTKLPHQKTARPRQPLSSAEFWGYQAAASREKVRFEVRYVRSKPETPKQAPNRQERPRDALASTMLEV